MSRPFGRPRRHYRRTESTNDRARELAATGACSGTIVTADEQSAGRGRLGRRWSAPAGTALLYSAVLRELDEGKALLPLAVPVAVCEAIEALAPVSCAIKWPNDVWIEERKVAGVLIEARPPDWAVIGIGINLDVPPDSLPRDLRWPATSVGHGAGPAEMLEALNRALSSVVDAPPPRVLSEFRARDALRGRRIEWERAGEAGSGSGTAAGIAETGDLLVSVAGGGRLSLGAGEVALRLGDDPS